MQGLSRKIVFQNIGQGLRVVHSNPWTLCGVSSLKCEGNYTLGIGLSMHKSFSNMKYGFNPKEKIGGFGYSLLVVPIGTFLLGIWQVQRRKWKINLISELEQKTIMAPIKFPDRIEDIEDFEYRKVVVVGHFDHDKEMYLGPRSMLVEGGKGQTSQMFSGTTGFNVITPFKLSNTGITILVNRGWVPRKLKVPTSRIEGQVTDEVFLTGVVRKQENRPPLMPKGEQYTKDFLYRDVITMAELAGTSPVFLDAVETFKGGPIGSQTRVSLRNEHLTYIVTWFSLSLATSIIWYRKFIIGKPIM